MYRYFRTRQYYAKKGCHDYRTPFIVLTLNLTMIVSQIVSLHLT